MARRIEADDARSSEPLDEALRKRKSQIAPARLDAQEPMPLKVRLEATAHILDFRQLGHALISLAIVLADLPLTRRCHGGAMLRMDRADLSPLGRGEQAALFYLPLPPSWRSHASHGRGEAATRRAAARSVAGEGAQTASHASFRLSPLRWIK